MSWRIHQMMPIAAGIANIATVQISIVNIEPMT